MAFLRLLKRPHLALLWLSQVLSSTGDTFYTVALIWTAVNVAGSSAGVVVAAGFATRVLFGPIGGVLADRWDHRQTLIGLDVTRAITVASLPLIHATGSLELWHLIVVSILLAAQSTIFDPALQASLPGLIKNKDDIVAMNGLMDGTRRLALALAPSLAGALVALMPLAQFFTLDALSFCVSARRSDRNRPPLRQDSGHRIGPDPANDRQCLWRCRDWCQIGADERDFELVSGQPSGQQCGLGGDLQCRRGLVGVKDLGWRGWHLRADSRRLRGGQHP